MTKLRYTLLTLLLLLFSNALMADYPERGNMAREHGKRLTVKEWKTTPDGKNKWVDHVDMQHDILVVTAAGNEDPGENNLYAKDNYKSKIIARIEDEVIGEIIKCPASNNFCLLSFDKIEGWMPRQNLYGLYEDEIID